MLEIHNFVLEINHIVMKNKKELFKIISISVVLVLVVGGFLLYLLSPNTKFERSSVLLLIPFIIIVLFAVFILYDKMKNFKSKIVSEDELTKKLKLKAGNTSFLISIYIWLLLYYIHGEYIQEDYLFGIGIMGMALTYALSYLFYSKFGKLNE